METREWLAKALKAKNTEDILELYNNILGLEFLLVWTVFETINFDKFMNIKKIKDFSFGGKIIFDTELEEIFNKFKKRYKDKEKVRNLCYEKSDCYGCKKNSDCLFYKLNSKEDDIKVQEKIYFLLYIIYRYRNNMFHGNKGIQSWLKFREQIIDCIIIMKKITKLPQEEIGEKNEELSNT